MSLLQQLAAQGIALELRGHSLHVNAPKGVMTPALMDQIRTRKQELIEVLELSPEQREALHQAEQTTAERARGEIPAHYTVTTVCRHCGPVPIFEGCPPAVEGCPWCFNRSAGLPVPTREKQTALDAGCKA